MSSLDDEGPRKLLCLTACLYRKPGMSPEDYHKYVSDVHVPLVNDLMVEFGVVHRTLVHNYGVPRELAAVAADPFPLEQMEDFEIISTCVISDVEKFRLMKMEAHWTDKVLPDWKNFADAKRTKLTVGWYEERIREGKSVNA